MSISIGRRCLVVFLACLLGLAGACEKSTSETERNKPLPAGPSVLLITLDTTRADRLGCYGHEQAKTPALDSIAQVGVRFEQAFCQVPLTLPSHVSLLSGTLPPSNGIHTNGAAAIDKNLPSLAGAFKERGYETAAFVSAWVLDSMFGLDRGFDHYGDKLAHAGATVPFPQQRPANAVCDDALAWLQTQGETPYFVWVHFFDPHDPYDPPREYREQCDDLYDGEIAFMDSQIRRLTDWIKANDSIQETLIVIAGDHGEAFMEHGETTHGLFLYDTTMRVPLIMSWPTVLPENRVVKTGVRLIDVFPTIVDIMGWEEIDGLQGESLKPSFQTDEFPPLPAYGETQYAKVGFGWAPLRSYTTQQWKYIEAPKPELYDRNLDPEESMNVAGKYPEVVARLHRELEESITGLPTFSTEAVALDPRNKQAMESLGYVGGAASSNRDDSDMLRRDPKDMLEVLDRFHIAKGFLKERRFAAAADILLAITKASPESDEFHAALSAAYLELGRFKEAERESRFSLRTVPDDPHKLCRLGDSLFRQKRVAEAVKCYKKSLESSPGHAPAHNKLGVIYFQNNDLHNALHHLGRSVELNPNSPSALTNLASVHIQMGNLKRGDELLRGALRLDPDFGPAKRFLGELQKMSSR